MTVRGARRQAVTATLLGAGITVALAAGLGACTVGGDESFREINDVRVPTVPAITTSTTRAPTTVAPTTTVPRSTTTIAAPSTTVAPTTSTTPTTAPVLVEERLYFVTNATKLKLVVRRVPTTAGINTVLTDLGKGPLPIENLRTAVKPDYWGDTSIGTNGVATVELRPAFSSLSDSEAQLALAQIVYTLTELGGVGQVAFVRDGEPLSVPQGDGLQTVKAVSKDDYPAFAGQ